MEFIEERADEFALELLIPSSILQELFSAESIKLEAKAARIADEFEVSIEIAQLAITPKEERAALRVPPALS
jgi:Zn-dependent peptidase ImmA (M78 family)